jgi:hypothetical protein
MDKMTNVKALEFVLANCEIPADVAAKLTSLKGQYERKSAKNPDRKPTAAQIKRKAIADAVYAFMIPDTFYTLTELAEGVPELGAIENPSPQKYRGVVGVLIDAKLVEATKEKGKTYYSLTKVEAGA